jgi:positive regulator of sigma E activity
VFESGKVLKVSEGRAAVQDRREPGRQCGGCSACRLFGEQGFVLWVDAAELRADDRVTVEVPQVNPWRAIAMVFALPLAALVAGLIAGSRWPWLQHHLGMDAGMTGLVLGAGLALVALVLAWLDDKRFSRQHRPHVVEVQHPE